MQEKTKQITTELGNAAQKGRYERETHARYRLVRYRLVGN